jgi:hypothetical protein
MDFSTFDELFAMDEDKSKKGVEIEVGINRNGDPIVFTIGDVSHPDHQRILRKYDKALENSRHIPKKRALVYARFLSEAILKDWRGVIDTEGNEIPATKENKIAVLAKYEKFSSIVVDEMLRTENFRPEVNSEDSPEEDTEKNLSTA